MKLNLLIVSAMAVTVIASPTPQRDPPEKPTPCDECDKHFAACKSSCWWWPNPQACHQSCEIETCHWKDGFCHNNCGYNIC